MIQVTKIGKENPDYVFHVACTNPECECEFTFKKSDCTYEEGTCYIECPECGRCFGEYLFKSFEEEL